MLWRVNLTSFILADLANGALPGHNVTGTNILINIPVNNTEYVCVSLIDGGESSNDLPYYIIVAGEYVYLCYVLKYVISILCTMCSYSTTAIIAYYRGLQIN